MISIPYIVWVCSDIIHENKDNTIQDIMGLYTLVENVVKILSNKKKKIPKKKCFSTFPCVVNCWSGKVSIIDSQKKGIENVWKCFYG